MIAGFIAIFIAVKGESQLIPFAFQNQGTDRLAFTTAAQTLEQNLCSGIVTVQTRSPGGNAKNVTSNTTISLSAPGGTQFFSDATCLNPITSLTIASGANSASFYFEAQTGTNTTIGATTAGFASASQTHNLTSNSFLWTGAGANSNWSTAANWSGGSVPGSSNVAIFLGSACSTNCSPTIDANISVRGVRVKSGYTGTITQQAGRTMTIGAAGWTQESGTFLGSSSGDAISVTGVFGLSGGTFRSTSGIASFRSVQWNIFNSPTFNANGGRVHFEETTTTMRPGSISFNDLSYRVGYGVVHTVSGTGTVAGNLMIESVNTCCQYMEGGTLNVRGNVVMSGIGMLNGTLTVNLNGNADQNVDVSASTNKHLPSIRIASTGGTVRFVGNPTFTRSFEYVSGTVDFGTTTATFNFAEYMTLSLTTSAAVQFNDVVLDYAYFGYMNLSGVLRVNGNLSFTDSICCSSVNGGTIQVGGNVSVTGSGAGSYQLEFIGSSGSTLSTVSGLVTTGLITVNKTGGASLMLLSNFSFNSAGQSMNVVSGGVNMNGRNLTVNSALTLNGNTITKNGGVLRVGGSVIGDGSLLGGTVNP